MDYHSASSNYSDAISSDEQRRRENAVRAGIASATIEGGSIGPEARAIMNQWARGLIPENQAFQQIDALHSAAEPSQQRHRIDQTLADLRAGEPC